MKPAEDLSRVPLFRAVEKITYLFTFFFVAFIVTECHQKKSEMDEQLEERHQHMQSLKDQNNCHEEMFIRYQLGQRIEICVQDGMILASGTTTPPDHWMETRYPQIVDSLRNIDNRSGL